MAIARELAAALEATPDLLDRELAEQRGLSPSFVSRHLALLRMSDQLQQLVDRGLGVLTALQVQEAEFRLIDGEKGWEARDGLGERCDKGERAECSVGEVVDAECVVAFVDPAQLNRGFRWVRRVD